MNDIVSKITSAALAVSSEGLISAVDDVDIPNDDNNTPKHNDEEKESAIKNKEVKEKEKPKLAYRMSTQGRKPMTRSTKAEMNRERLTAKVITLLVSGKTNEEIANELDISESFVFRIRTELPHEFLEFFSSAKTNEISSLIEAGLKAQLEAMTKIVEVTNDEIWLKAQRAPELATFFGVINDKTVRVLAAIERADERARSERGQDVLASRSGVQEGGEIRQGV